MDVFPVKVYSLNVLFIYFVSFLFILVQFIVI